MKQLPERPSLEHLKKQAKDLFHRYREHDRAAFARLREFLPAAAGKDDAAIAALGLRLHDAQSCIARDYGFPSWTDLRTYVAAQPIAGEDRATRVLRWLRLVYASEIAGGDDRANPLAAARMLADDPGLVRDDPYLACAVGDAAVLQAATRSDPAWVNRAGGPLNIPPLLAIAHSSLLRVPEFRARLHHSARLLLEAGADPNQSVGGRWAPASLEQPSTEYRLPTLYGAAGQNHDAALTQILLAAGAEPNDNESLYHALDDLACVRAMLDGGARVTGTNAMYRVFDFDNVAALELLLDHGGDANEPARSSPTNEWGSPLLWAIRRRRSRAHVEALLRAGADPRARTPAGVSAYRASLQFGLPEVAEMLRQAGGADQPSEEEEFIAACSRGDAPAARRIQAARPDLPAALSETQLRLLPDLAAAGHAPAVETMVELGWPIAVRGGDWNASALNLAVFRGDAAMTWFLLEHGAKWTEEHQFGDNACGTLSWASYNQPVAGGDWVGCAEALTAHGMPCARPDPDDAGRVLVGGRSKRFSDAVTEFLLGAG